MRLRWATILTNAGRLFLEGCWFEAARGEWWRGGGRQWFTTAASQRVWWKWCFAAGDSGARGVYSHRCVTSQGLRVHPHHTICKEQVQHQPQDCSEWVRPVNGETYPVRKANGCRPKKREGIVLSPWQQSSLKWNTKRSDYSRLKLQQIKALQRSGNKMLTAEWWQAQPGQH